MGSALLNPAAHAAAELHAAVVAPETPEELRRQVAARLAAHRERRLRKDTEPGSYPGTASAAHAPKKSRVAAAVAERYAHAQSYRAFLAAEAERAIQQAHAAAEIAARNAQAIAEAQQLLLDTLAVEARTAEAAAAPSQPDIDFGRFEEQALWPDLDSPAPAIPESSPRAQLEPAALPAVRIVTYDETPMVPLGPSAAGRTSSHRGLVRDLSPYDPEALALDEEISFRQAPVFEEPPGPPMPLPANLIEFPRQLVAARKVRPRYAEGPLREQEIAGEGAEQLRIFEVHPAQISTTPVVSEPAAAAPQPQWTSLWLDSAADRGSQAHTADTHQHVPAVASPVTLHTARLSRRLLAASIDLAITALAGIACATASAGTMALLAGEPFWQMEALRAVAGGLLHAVPLPTLGMTALAGAVLLSAMLQTLCFAFSDATPGMRLARIGLCTFSDENPTRGAMLRRVPALLLSTGLFGLGFVWSLLDQDRLTWHDLISRMYQRSY